MTCRTTRNWESKHIAKIARLEGGIASSKVIQIPDILFGVAAFHPDTEARQMFSFIDADISDLQLKTSS